MTGPTGATGATGAAAQPYTLNTQTASYTLVLADAGKVVEQNVATANNLTVPPNSSSAFPTGTEITVVQYGAGATTIVPGAGVTLRSLAGNLVLAGQYSWAKLIKRATDEWDVMVFGTVAPPRELARVTGPTTAQTGISTVTDITQLTIPSFTVANYPVDVILEPPHLAAVTNSLSGGIEIYDTTNSAIKAQKGFSAVSAGAYMACAPLSERITTPGTYARKVRIRRDTGAGTISVSIAGGEATLFGTLKVVEVAT